MATMSAAAHGALSRSENPAPDMTAGFDIVEDDITVEASPAMSYTTPQGGSTTFVPATPVAAPYEKDLSGFCDVDDSVDFDEID